jgi:serine/threonine-protein phosphatase 6 regulatory ankyrin repeat subunit B
MPLHWAAEKGYLNIVTALLDTVKANPGELKKLTSSVTKTLRDIPLNLAAFRGHTKVVEILLVVSEGDYNSHGWGPLHHAAHNGHYEAVKLLANANPNDINHPTFYGGHTPLHEAAYGEGIEDGDRKSKEDYIKIVNFLIEKGAKVNAKDKDGSTPLYSAARQGHLDIVKILVENKAEVVEEAGAGIGITPLYAAVLYGHPEIVEFLLEKGATIDFKKGLLGECAITALHIAAILPSEVGGLKITEYLLKNGADINAKAKITPDSPKAILEKISQLAYIENHPINKYLKSRTLISFISTIVSFVSRYEAITPLVTPLDVAEALDNTQVAEFLKENRADFGNKISKIIFIFLKQLYPSFPEKLYSSFKQHIWKRTTT